MKELLEWIRKSGKVIYSTQSHEHQKHLPFLERKCQLNLIHINAAGELIQQFSFNLLEWIAEQGYVFEEKGWYKRGSYRPWRPTVYYTYEQLIELYDKRSQDS